MFKRAWEASFTVDNIVHAFVKPGIWPIDSEIIMSKIRKPILLPKTPDHDVKTPLTAKAIRKFTIRFQKSPSKERAEKASKALQILAAEKSIILHENYGLREALVLEQKKLKAVEFQAEKDRLQVLEDEAKERRKIQRAANALKKKEEEEVAGWSTEWVFG
ncbi:hypothetical protein DL95DRAFT_471385 [Leptodontidium sp. 2 PMI_412]|nr:hypothetical protein DL95DRAFT_471385 [Leptodontidium sp. 2 PMI_412]